jgi:hypothetical protein
MSEPSAPVFDAPAPAKGGATAAAAGVGGDGGAHADEKIEELHGCPVRCVCEISSWLNKKGEGKGLLGRRNWAGQFCMLDVARATISLFDYFPARDGSRLRVCGGGGGLRVCAAGCQCCSVAGAGGWCVVRRTATLEWFSVAAAMVCLCVCVCVYVCVCVCVCGCACMQAWVFVVAWWGPGRCSGGGVGGVRVRVRVGGVVLCWGLLVCVSCTPCQYSVNGAMVPRLCSFCGVRDGVAVQDEVRVTHATVIDARHHKFENFFIIRTDDGRRVCFAAETPLLKVCAVALGAAVAAR